MILLKKNTQNLKCWWTIFIRSDLSLLKGNTHTHTQTHAHIHTRTHNNLILISIYCTFQNELTALWDLVPIEKKRKSIETLTQWWVIFYVFGDKRKILIFVRLSSGTYIINTYIFHWINWKWAHSMLRDNMLNILQIAFISCIFKRLNNIIRNNIKFWRRFSHNFHRIYMKS